MSLGEGGLVLSKIDASSHLGVEPRFASCVVGTCNSSCSFCSTLFHTIYKDTGALFCNRMILSDGDVWSCTEVPVREHYLKLGPVCDKWCVGFNLSTDKREDIVYACTPSRGTNDMTIQQTQRTIITYFASHTSTATMQRREVRTTGSA